MRPCWVLVFLQLWAVWEACGLSVLQWPLSLRVKPGGAVTLACQVTQIQEGQRLRVEWTRNEDGFCHMFLTNGSLSPEVCGTRGRLFWKVPGDFTLQLRHVSVNDSGDYVCRAILEIPELDEAQGNGTELLVEADVPPQLQETSFPPGFQLALLVVVGVVAAGVLLGAGLWCSRRCKREDSRNPLYCNVLYRPQGTPKSCRVWPGDGKAQDRATEDRKVQDVCSAACPQPTPHQLWTAKHPFSVTGISPSPGP